MNNMSRGIRNNNPANIIRGSKWSGLSQIQPDSKFCTFIKVEFGVRALIYLLLRYYRDYKLYSVRDIISRFAPPIDGNNTEEYIYKISNLLYVTDTEHLNLKSYYTLFSLCKHICFIESYYVLTERVFELSFNMLPLKFKNYVKKRDY